MSKAKPSNVTANTTPVAVENKSKAIREYHAANPSATPAEIAKALTAKGIEVNASRVSSVISSATRGPKVDMASIKLASSFIKASKGSIEDAAAAIESVGAFIDECGGKDEALAALVAFKELSEAIS